MNNSKISILTPTFNDEEFIGILITSIFSQSYNNWEWIIINDGSTDGTSKILEKISKDKRVTVLEKDNGDQLNALQYALPYITGDYVTLIHSDDCFKSSNSIAEIVSDFPENADGVYADLEKIDAEGNFLGVLKTPENFPIKIERKLLLGMGCNYFGDPFFLKKSIFNSHVVSNYLKNNKIYYSADNGKKKLNLRKISSWYRYRVFSQNYINSDVGKFVALTGQFRTVSDTIRSTNESFLNLAFGYNVFRFLRYLDLDIGSSGVIKNNVGKNLFEFWAKDLKRYKYPEILIRIALAISNSFKQKRNGTKVIFIDLNGYDKKYTNADARRFYRDITQDDLAPLILQLLSYDVEYFEVRDEKSKEIIENLLSFLCLPYKVKIKNEDNNRIPR